MTQEELYKIECDKETAEYNKLIKGLKGFGEELSTFFKTQRQIREKVGKGIGEFVQDLTGTTKKVNHYTKISPQAIGQRMNRRRVIREVDFNENAQSN